MKIKYIISFTAMLLFLSSCGIYTNYKRPTDISTEGLYGTEVSSLDLDTVSLGNKSWQEVFPDFRLQNLIAKGLEQNADLEKASLQIDEARAALMASRMAFLPSLALQPQGTLSSYDGGAVSKTYQLPVAASWQVDLFGQLLNASKGSKAALLQSKAYHQSVQTQLIANIANVYYTLVMLDEQLRITQQTSVLWKENVRVMKALMKAGHTNQAAVSQAEANYQSIQTAVMDIEHSINETENALSLLMNESSRSYERSNIKEISFPKDLTIGVPLQLLSHRPDVKMAELSLAQYYYGVAGARSAFYPSIVINGSFGWTNVAGGMIANPAKTLASAVGTLTQPIFNKGRNIANLKIAQSRYESSKLTFQQSLLRAGNEVNNALLKTQTARAKNNARKNQISALEKAVQSTKLMMQHSNTTYLEVLVAEQSLLQAQTAQLSDWLEEAQGVTSLYQALGGGSTED